MRRLTLILCLILRINKEVRYMMFKQPFFFFVLYVQYRNRGGPYQKHWSLYWTFQHFLHLIKYKINLFIGTLKMMKYSFRSMSPIILVNFREIPINYKRTRRHQSQGVQYSGPSPSKVDEDRTHGYDTYTLPGR